jgi:hypothetical protein
MFLSWGRTPLSTAGSIMRVGSDQVSVVVAISGSVLTKLGDVAIAVA